LWLWTSDHSRLALATGDLAVIIRAYRAATGASQRQLAELLGYDPTYISMIETGRREINDVATRLRIARHLGLPPHTLGAWVSNASIGVVDR
jgi:transcriptional regulator with XRE-family HTH domain